MIEKALLIASRTDGPWMPVTDLQEIEVEGLGDGDAIEVWSEQETLLEITDNGIHSVNLAEGKVMIHRRHGNESRVTVTARAER